MENFIGLGPKFVLKKGLVCKIESTDDYGDKSTVIAKITKVFPGDASNKELCLLKAITGLRRYASFRNEIKSIQFG